MEVICSVPLTGGNVPFVVEKKSFLVVRIEVETKIIPLTSPWDQFMTH
jgi:hypothetical protein